MTDSPQTKYERLRPWLLLAIAWVIAFDVAWLSQRLSGAHTNEFGANPREGMHFVTGLTLRDFMAAAPSDTIAREFVERYAKHYPVVDTHIWPPVFHGIEGGWMMVFGTKRMTVLMLMAGLAATAATVVWGGLVKDFGFGLATVGGLTLLCLPIFRHSFEVVLAEPLAAILLLAAALKWGRYLDEGRAADALAFGLLSGLALLTDVSAFALLIQAPISAMIARRAERLRQPVAWAGLALALGIGAFVLWYLSGNVSLGRPLRNLLSWEFTRDALPFYLGKFGMGLGFVLLLFFVIGLVGKVRSGVDGAGKWISLAVTLGFALVLLADVPKSTDSRHLIPLIPIAVMFVAAGITSVGERLSKRQKSISGAAGALTAAAALLAIAGVVTAQLVRGGNLRERWTGYGEGAEQILKSPSPGNRQVLISSDAIGESALISEIANRDKRPGHVVKQSSQELMRNDGLVGGNRPRFETSDELASWFQRSGFMVLAVDHSIAEQDRSEVHDQLARAAHDHPEVFWPMAEITITRGREDAQGLLTIYGVKAPRPPAN